MPVLDQNAINAVTLQVAAALRDRASHHRARKETLESPAARLMLLELAEELAEVAEALDSYDSLDNICAAISLDLSDVDEDGP